MKALFRLIFFSLPYLTLKNIRKPLKERSQDRKIESSPELNEILKILRSEKKFTEHQFYPGAPSEEVRTRCENRIDQFLDDLSVALDRGTTTRVLQSKASKLQQEFRSEDTEERERAGDYIANILARLGIGDI